MTKKTANDENELNAATKKETLNVFEPKYIVGIGASAGGLEALQKLLTDLPSNTGFPYIIVQHLSPDYKSLLSEILSKYTDMPVLQVEDGMEVKPDFVYVISPGKNMRISKGKLLLSAQKEHELNLPIDLFLTSLAEEAGQRAIAVILSGTGSDGTNGIKSVKENDGMIIVQDPESAKFDGMPRSALRTGLVDAQLAPEEIAMEIQHISIAAHADTSQLKTERQIDEDLMKKIYFILKKVSNVNFTHYKQTTILRRIERRMMLTHKETLADYVDLLYESQDEVKTLSKEVLIGVTNFFRDPEYFQILKDSAIKNILLHSSKEDPVRVWVAGCSTGEEAYSIAILFCEVMDSLKIKRQIKIFATDLDVESITTAGKGVYSESIVDTISATRLSRYFTRRNNTYVVSRDLRKMIVFSPHNVFQDPPFGRLDLISCRNMLIYFQSVLQNDLFAIFHSSLKDGGYLFLGKSEAIGLYTEAFPVVDAAAKIFTHRNDVRIAGAKAIPFLQPPFSEDDYYEESAAYNRRSAAGEINPNESIIDSKLLEFFMPACLVVNEKNELVHTFGENANYIHFSVGKVSNSLYDVINESLKIPVSTLLKESRELKKMIQYKNIRISGEREEAMINLTALPISRKEIPYENLYAIVFTEVKDHTELPDAIPYEIDGVASRRITDLESDLSEIQDKLNRSMSEQETVNEELQAANEELLTANEELQSSNEELQSVNEELYTVNSEYQTKLSELADLNDDIANFLSTTLIGIIFVDNKLSIRRYTDYVASEFSVMDHDIGRSLKFISYHFPTVDISEICENVLKTLVPDEREITTSRNKVFFMRVAPYRTTENKILGCVITLVDVSKQKQGAALLMDAEQQLSLAQQSSLAKSDFLSQLAFEIKTPVSSLTSLAALAKGQLDDKEELCSSLDKITETVNSLTAVVTDVLDASRAQSIDPEGLVEPFSLNLLLDQCLSVMTPQAEEAGLNLSLNVSKDLAPSYVGSVNRLRQIIIAFLSYSIKYTPRGGSVNMEVKEEYSLDDKASISLVVSDTGIGISEKLLPGLFKPVGRDKLLSGTEEGKNSPNLSVAYSLVKTMNGDVDTKSEVGKGTTFTIHVLLDKYSLSTERLMSLQHKSSSDHQYHLDGLNILVVDDNKVNRQILSMLLNREGVTTVEAKDGEMALKTYLDSPDKAFDCILMDIIMPKLDGIKATAMIRDSEKPDALTIPIIGVSANGFPEDVKKAELAGVNSYTTKPIDVNILFTNIRELTKRI